MVLLQNKSPDILHNMIKSFVLSTPQKLRSFEHCHFFFHGSALSPNSKSSNLHVYIYSCTISPEYEFGRGGAREGTEGVTVPLSGKLSPPVKEE